MTLVAAATAARSARTPREIRTSAPTIGSRRPRVSPFGPLPPRPTEPFCIKLISPPQFKTVSAHDAEPATRATGCSPENTSSLFFPRYVLYLHFSVFNFHATIVSTIIFSRFLSRKNTRFFFSSEYINTHQLHFALAIVCTYIPRTRINFTSQENARVLNTLSFGYDGRIFRDDHGEKQHDYSTGRTEGHQRGRKETGGDGQRFRQEK